jgi:hypothetical protein
MTQDLPPDADTPENHLGMDGGVGFAYFVLWAKA